jgi:enoyl-[acyl-carrier protein] reductase I
MLSIDLRGKKAFIAGIGDDRGFGWAIAKMLHQAGAEVIAGVWPPMLQIFQHSLDSGKYDESRKLSDGGMLEFSGIYPMDAMFDVDEDVPSEIRENKRYKDLQGYSISATAKKIREEKGEIDIVVHSLANGPEVKNLLLDTSRKGYLAAISSSAYSFVSMVSNFGPLMPKGGAFLNLTYIASESVVPGYGGGMSSAKAALESDTRVLAYEAGVRYGVRVNSISAGPFGSRAAKAIGFIEKMIVYSEKNSPLQRSIDASDVGNAAAFLCSPLSSSITGIVLHVDCGMHAMGVALDSESLRVEV